jgi:hypothetical protein
VEVLGALQEQEEQLLALQQSGVSQLCRDVQDVKLNQGVDQTTVMKQLSILNAKNVMRIGNQPVQMLVAAETTQQEENRFFWLVLLLVVECCLMNLLLQVLYELWREYLHASEGQET